MNNTNYGQNSNFKKIYRNKEYGTIKFTFVLKLIQ